MESWFAALVDSSLRAVAIAGGVGVILWIVGIRKARARHVAWTGVLVAMMLSPVGFLLVPRISLHVLPAAEPIPLTEALLIPAPPPPIPVTEIGPAGKRWPVPSQHTYGWYDALALVYSAVALLLVGRLVLGTAQILCLLHGARRHDGVFSTDKCRAPIAVGVLRASILLPADWESWPSAKRQAVLLHEEEHVRRRDPLIQWLAALNRSLFWFHPLAWWLERRLSTLAEVACDDAVLAGGHGRVEYAELLVEFAREVARRVGRLSAWSPGIEGHRLDARLRRILAEHRTPPMSTARIATAALSCALTIGLGMACELQRTSTRAPGQPTMNELMHRQAAKSQAGAKKWEALRQEAASLTKDQVRVLEARLRRNPDDQELIEEVKAYFEIRKEPRGWSEVVLWGIEHAPASNLAALYIEPAEDKEGFERGRRLWLTHAEASGANAEVFSRAALFIKAADQPLAERLLLSGQKAFLDDRRWSGYLGRLYYEVLVGSTGTLPLGVVRSVSLSAAHGPYATEVQRKLAESRDSDLLIVTGRQLLYQGANLYRSKLIDFDPVPLGNSYLDRAHVIDPNNEEARAARAERDVLERHRATETLLRGRSPEEVLRNASNSDRLLLLPGLMRKAQFRNDLANADVYARELLDAAEQNRKHPKYGDFVFDANMMRARVALRAGNAKSAARYLLAAAETPGSERLTYNSISMEVPRTLVDWGQREAVARFLERCARFNRNKSRLEKWAQEIRSGINPDLIPYMTGCAQEPC